MADWPALVLIADASFGDDAVRKVRAILEAVPPAEVAVIDRWKVRDGPVTSRLVRLRAMADVVHEAGARLWVSQRADLAAVVGAQGVHLPERSANISDIRAAFPDLVIGRSCHDRAGLERCRADYALLSPLEAPHSKPLEGKALHVEGFASAIAGLGIPTYALGGVEPRHAQSLKASGAAGLATLGGILGAHDPVSAAVAFFEAWQNP